MMNRIFNNQKKDHDIVLKPEIERAAIRYAEYDCWMMKLNNKYCVHPTQGQSRGGGDIPAGSILCQDRERDEDHRAGVCQQYWRTDGPPHGLFLHITHRVLLSSLFDSSQYLQT